MQWHTFVIGAIWGAAIVQGGHAYGWAASLGLAFASVLIGVVFEAGRRWQ